MQNKKDDEINISSEEISQLNEDVKKLNHNLYQTYNTLQKSENTEYFIGFWTAIFFPIISLLVFLLITACDKKISKLKKDCFILGWKKGTIVLFSTLALIGVFVLVFFIVFNHVKDDLILELSKKYPNV